MLVFSLFALSTLLYSAAIASSNDFSITEPLKAKCEKAANVCYLGKLCSKSKIQNSNTSTGKNK